MLYGKTIVVTGVSSGIGARTAELAVQRSAPRSSATSMSRLPAKPPRSSSFIGADGFRPTATAASTQIVARGFAAALRRALQRRRNLRHSGRGEDAARQFLRPARALGSRRAASARRRRRRQRRLDRRLWLARQSRTRQGARRRRRLPRQSRARRQSCDQRRRRLSRLKGGSAALDPARGASALVPKQRGHPRANSRSSPGLRSRPRS